MDKELLPLTVIWVTVAFVSAVIVLVGLILLIEYLTKKK